MRLFILGGLIVYCGLSLLFLSNKDAYEAAFVNPLLALQVNANKSDVLNRVPFPVWFNIPARNDKEGAYIYDRDAMQGGDLTLFTAADETAVHLIDAEGREVHRWAKTFSEAWPGGAPHVANPVPPSHICVGRAFLDPAMNGDVILEYFGNGDLLYEYGRARLGKDSGVKTLWPMHLHHDLAFLPDGGFVTPLLKVTYDEKPEMPHVEPPYAVENLVVFDKDGNEVKRASVLDALLDSGARSYIQSLGVNNSDGNVRRGDILHLNTVSLVPPEAVGTAPMLKENRVLLSFRNIDMLAIMDLGAMKIEWAAFGPWRGQHSPRFLPNGHVVMFDNFGDLTGKGGSRIIELDLNTLHIVWEYRGEPGSPLSSPYNGMVEPLPGGNLLVTETMAGRIFEVTPDKKVVWEYYTPRRTMLPGDAQPRIPSLFSARRYRREDLPFLKAALRAEDEPAPETAP